MQCPSCGNPATEGDAFCGTCGAALPGPQAEQPTQQMPQQPAPQPAPQPAAQPAVVQPTQQMPQVPQAPQPQATPYAQPGQPYAAAQAGQPRAKGLSTGAIIGIVLAGVFVVAGLAVGGFFAWRALSADEPEEIPVAAEATDPATSDIAIDDPAEAAEPVGFATPEEALAELLPEGWVSDILTNEEDTKEYVIGPPSSEYTDVVVVVRQPDGSWVAEESYAYDTGGTDGGSDSGMSPEDEATQVVGEFLYAVKEDRADDAHAYTISPFAEDPASAQYSNGDLLSIEVTDAQLQSDGSTVWVWSKEQWAWGTESYLYVCVPTDAGYRISELRIP